MTEIKIGIAGCAGRMGKMLVSEVIETPGCMLAGGFETPGHDAIGRDIGVIAGHEATECAISDDAHRVFSDADIILDFTLPSATQAHAMLAANTGTGLVIGTTGLDTTQTDAIEVASKSAAILHAANTSVGINLLVNLTRDTAGILDSTYDIEVVEMHHRHKVDAPSGTALALGRAAAQGREVDLSKVEVHGRDGFTGAREPGAVGFAVLRGGDVVGDHSVIFAADGERIELTHKASSRRVFSRGAVRAALWLHDMPAGLYNMDDVLGIQR